MKQRTLWMLAPAVALGLGACKKKEVITPAETPGVEAPTQSTQPATPPVVTTPALSAEERAAKLGFVKHLPEDTEVVLAFHNGSKSVDRIKASKMWKLIEEQMGSSMPGGAAAPNPDGVGDDDEMASPEESEQAATSEPAAAPDASEPTGPAALFAKEFTLAVGKSAGEQTGNLLTLNRRLNYFQMRSLAKSLAAAAKAGDFSPMETAMSDRFGPELAKDILADPESGIALFEKLKMPPLYLAFRAEGAGKEAAAQQLASLVENVGMLGEMVAPLEVEVAGHKFAGQKISGEKISKIMAAEREDMEEMMEPADVDKLLAAVAKKDLVVLSGTIGDYAILFLGASADDLKLTTDTAKSLCGSNALAFCDAYAAKQLAAVTYSQKGTLDEVTNASGYLADMANGVRDGLAGAEGLGDTRDLESLLRMVAERETALRKLTGNETFGMAAFFEDGLKIESHGGTDSGAVDWKSPNKLGALGKSEDVAVFFDMTADAAYDQKARDYMEALTETGYALAMKASELPLEGEKMAQFKQMTQLFDSKFRADTIALWDTLSGDFSHGLGKECALVVDLKGAVPPIPNVPQAVVDEGKFPRVSLVAPVTDRAKLAASWEQMNASLTRILANVGEVSGQKIPMQKPTSSEKNGNTTYWFSIPFTNDDFLPSVTVGDQWFAASTSKNQANDLITLAGKGGDTHQGLRFVVNFKALQKFSLETIKMLDKNKQALGLSGSDLIRARRFTEAMEELDELNINARREAGVLRTSVHFKTR